MRDRDDDAPVEHDPTGMRDLLASLPEPGPMPADLVARITASLAQEAAATHSPDAVGGARILELPLSRRSPWPLLGVAAAVVGVLGLGGLVLSTAPGGLTAALDLGGRNSDSSAGSAAQLAPDSSGVEGARSGAVVTWSGTTYDTSNLASRAAGLMSDTGAAASSASAVPPSVATPEGARSCADGLGIDPGATLVVDVATFEGRPAAVLLVTQGSVHTAYAVERSCSARSHEVISGPVAVTP